MPAGTKSIHWDDTMTNSARSSHPEKQGTQLQPWEVLKSQDVFSAPPWVRVCVEEVRLPDGKTVDDYYQIKLTDYAMVFAETTEGRVIVERQYKHGIRKVSLTLPAGNIEKDEDPLGAAKRELFEETGYASDEWQSLGTFVIHGNYRCCLGHLFRVRKAQKVAEPNSGDLEEMEIVFMTPSEIVDALLKGDIASIGAAALVAMATNPLMYKGD